MAKEEINVEIGKRLQQQRKRLNLTQEQAAELLDISPTYYGALERGEKRLSLEKVVMIYRCMGIDPTYLLTGKGAMNAEFIEVFKNCPSDKQESLEQILTYLIKLSK